MENFRNNSASIIVDELITAIQQNKQYLSDIDGAIGDGDHGINMNKGFTMCREELDRNPGDLTYSLKILSRILIMDIGGSMGPLYGMFFKALSKTCGGNSQIDAGLFGDMLKAGETAIKEIGGAEVGDKTLLDTLTPAVRAFEDSTKKGAGFAQALNDMKEAAIKGRDSTKDMIARVGRSSRLGERSRGVIDAGAASSCIILEVFADSVARLLTDKSPD